MDNAKVKEHTNLVTVENMKDRGAMDDILVLAFVLGKMVDVTRGTLRINAIGLISFYFCII
jgi:hypothetical protein